MNMATANLDFTTETEVRKIIEIIKKENVVIIITHRLSMIEDPDHVIVLDKGLVAKEGTPDELLAKGGWFSNFVNFFLISCIDLVFEIGLKTGPRAFGPGLLWIGVPEIFFKSRAHADNYP